MKSSPLVNRHKVPLDPVVASLTRPLTSRLAHAVDILVFNPPYVPTYDDEMDGAQRDAGIAGSWAGGIDGMQVTKILLGQVDVGNSSVTLWMRIYPRYVFRTFSHLVDDSTWWL